LREKLETSEMNSSFFVEKTKFKKEKEKVFNDLKERIANVIKLEEILE
jgi:hypothetical protein